MKSTLENTCLQFAFEESLLSTTVPKLRQDCQSALTNHPEVSTVLANLSQVEMIDSIGLNFLVSVFNDVQKSGREFSIIGISESNRRLFEMVNLQEHVTLR